MERERLDMQAVHRWDDTALTMLYRHFYKALVAFSVQIVAQTQVAEEIVQDIFVRSWQRRNTFITEGALRAYLYNSVRNESISYLRRQRTEQNRMEAYEREWRLQADDADADSQWLQREEAIRRLLNAIDRLPARQREVFLRVVKGKTTAEIASELGLEPGSVKKQRQRGIERLRGEMDQQGE